MNSERQARQVEHNYDVFVRQLAALLPAHRNTFALMRDGEIEAFFTSPGAADEAGRERHADGVYSIQEVTDDPIDLGFWSHAAGR